MHTFIHTWLVRYGWSIADTRLYPFITKRITHSTYLPTYT